MKATALTPGERQALLREVFESMRAVTWAEFQRTLRGDSVFEMTPSESLRNGFYRNVEKDWPEWQRDTGGESDSELVAMRDEYIEKGKALGLRDDRTTLDRLHDAGIGNAAESKRACDEIIEQFLRDSMEVDEPEGDLEI